MDEHKGLPILAFASQDAWAEWLDINGAASKGLWLKLAKKGSGRDSVSRVEAIETALAHGWIDGQLDRFDEASWLVRFTPRGPASKWSQVNREAALRLIEQHRMLVGQKSRDAAAAQVRAAIEAFNMYGSDCEG